MAVLEPASAGSELVPGLVQSATATAVVRVESALLVERWVFAVPCVSSCFRLRQRGKKRPTVAEASLDKRCSQAWQGSNAG
jgi:hypothetical protein